MCKEGLNNFESQCKGLCLFKDDKSIIIDSNSCYNGSHKVIYRNRRTFPDGTYLDYDEILMCADEKVLKEIVDVVKKRFD
jgi:hypothetical protein